LLRGLWLLPQQYTWPFYTLGCCTEPCLGTAGDVGVADSRIAKPDLLYWLHNINDVNGRSWLHSLEYIHVVGDAFSIGYAAFTPNAELANNTIISFDQFEIAQTNANKLSSVLHETKNVRLALETVINSLPAAQLVGKVFVYTGDCAPAIQGLLRMKGSIKVFPEVKRLYLTAAVAQLALDFIYT